LQIADAIKNEKSVEKKLKIFNVDRSVGGRVSGEIAKRYGDTGFAGEIKLSYVSNAAASVFPQYI